jgi:hypothetical protein
VAKAIKEKKQTLSTYTPEIGLAICQLVSTGSHGIDEICKNNPELPTARTIHTWCYKFPEFREQYQQAKRNQADILAEECLKIADNSTNATWGRDRLRIDTRKWLATKLLPKIYGDKVVLEAKNEMNEETKQELIELRLELDAKNKKDY